MLELAVFMPLAQLNGSSGAASSAPANPAAPAPAATLETAGAKGVTSTAATGAGAVTIGTTAPGTTAPATSAPGVPEAPASSPIFTIILMVVVLGGLYFFMMRPQRKEEKRRKGMISELKKGDRVMTIGGMLAKVVSVEGDEVVLKVDEAANVKATYRKTAIQEVIDRDDKK